MTAEHVASYYAATAHDDAARAPLQEHLTADVCVVGAGFTGIAAALELAERGYSVVVLEAERVGWGASGRNGGQIVNGYSRDLDVIAKRYGAAAGRAIGGMAMEGGDIIRERVHKYGIACDLVDGGMFVAATHKQMRRLEDRKRLWAGYGYEDFTLLDKAGLAAHVASERYVGGLLDHRGGHLHPLNLVQGEAAALERLGGRVFEGSRVISWQVGEQPVARTARGEVKAKSLIIACNAYIDGLAPELRDRMMPVSSQVLATEPLGEAHARRLLPSNVCVEDMNYVLDYYRRTPDHRLIYGGGVVYGGQDPESIRAKILPQMLKTFPDLRDARIDFAWSGNFALTLTRFPQIGRLGPHIYFSHGCSGHGVTTTHLLGRLLAEVISGNSSRFGILANLPYFPFPGGKYLRVPLTVLGSWYYRARDALGL